MGLMLVSLSAYGQRFPFLKPSLEEKSKEKTEVASDAKVGGWYFNLGITGARAKLSKDRKNLVVTYVFEDTPAYKNIQVGDIIIGINKKNFDKAYDSNKFGEEGPLIDFGNALEEIQRPQKKSKMNILQLEVLRGGKKITIDLKISTKYGEFSDKFPYDCPKVDKILEELYVYLLSSQKGNGSWGRFNDTTFATLALISSGRPEHLKAAEKGVRSFINDKTTWLPIWKNTFSGIVMSEYYLKTGEKWILPELEKIRDWLEDAQYMKLSHRGRTDETPRIYGKSPTKKHDLLRIGGWWHHLGWGGYGPMSITTGQAVLALSLIKRCGIDVDMSRLEAGYSFLERATNACGFVAYHDDANKKSKRGGPLGRVGVTALANFACPINSDVYLDRAMLNINCLNVHYNGMAHSHASATLGMGWAMAGAIIDDACYQNMLDRHKWFINLAHCPDGTFYCQPNRDYVVGAQDFIKAPRLSMSAALAFGLSIRNKTLSMTEMVNKEFQLPQIKIDLSEYSREIRNMSKDLMAEKLNRVHKSIVKYEDKLKQMKSDKDLEKVKEENAVLQKLKNYIVNTTKTLVKHINTFVEVGDFYKAQILMLQYKKIFFGIPEFDTTLLSLEDRFKGDDIEKMIVIGKAYYSLVEKMNEKKVKDKKDLLLSYQRFIKNYPDNIYCAACEAIVVEIEKFPLSKICPEQYIRQVASLE